MKSHKVNQDIDFSLEFQQKILEEFAQKVISTNLKHYTTQRKASKTNLLDQLFYAKLAEYAVAQLLNTDYNFPLIQPDINIYEKKQKNWEADLPYHKDNKKLPDIHVKSCSGCKYGTSWVFQLSDAKKYGGVDPILLNKNLEDFVAFVDIKYSQPKIDNFANIMYIISVADLHQYDLFKEPIVYQLRSIKTCVYSEDLKKIWN